MTPDRLDTYSTRTQLRGVTTGASFQAWRAGESRSWHLKLMTLSVWFARANRLSDGAVAVTFRCGWD